MIRSIVVMLFYDIKLWFGLKSRLLSGLIRPLLWLLVIGAGFSRITVGYDYQRYLLPGLMGMTILFGSILASLSMAQERHQGLMRMLMLAPFGHYWIIVGRVLSSALIACIQVIILIVLLIGLGFFHVDHISWIALLSLIISSAILFATIGVMVAIFAGNLENFTVVMNMLIFPLFFLSGALYPIQTSPSVLKYLMLANPFTYVVDLFQTILIPEHLNLLPLSATIAILGAHWFASGSLATWKFYTKMRL